MHIGLVAGSQLVDDVSDDHGFGTPGPPGWFIGIFVLFEASVYFALVAFTTLGFGDLLLPQEWRLLGGICAANGLLMIGLLTAILVETLRETRLRQRGNGP